MWPTFYIPESGGAGRQPTVVGHACAYTNYGGNITVDVPYPTGTQAGDLCIAYACGFPGGLPTTLTTDTNWIPMRCFYDSPQDHGPIGFLAFHWYDGTEAATETFTFNNAGVDQQRICIVSYRYVDQDMPFGSWTFADHDGTDYLEPIPLPQIYPNDARPAMISLASGGTGNLTYGLFDGVSAFDSKGDLDSEFPMVAEGQIKWSNLDHGLYHTFWTPISASEKENLLAKSYGGFNASPWTKVNCTVTDNVLIVDNGRYSSMVPTSTVSAERHALYTEVELTAGEQYTFAFCGIINNGGFSGYYGYMSADDGTDEQGCFFENDIVRNSFGSVALDAQWTSDFTANVNTGVYTYITFTAQRTGTHKLWLGVSDVNGTPEVTGFGGYGLTIYGVALFRGFVADMYNKEVWQNTSSSPVSGVAGLQNRVQLAGKWTNGQQQSLELRRAGGAASLIRFIQPDQGFQQLQNDTLTGTWTGTTQTWAISVSNYEPVWVTSSPAYPPDWGTNVPSKVYFEVIYREQANTPFLHTVGLVPDIYPLRGITTNSGSSFGDYLWRGDGTIEVNGVRTIGAYASYTAGDVLGIGLDWDNRQINFWKNGVHQGTMNLDSTRGTYNYPHWGSIRTRLNGDGGSTTFNTNLTGPFDYPQTGYSAFDWQNEQT